MRSYVARGIPEILAYPSNWSECLARVCDRLPGTRSFFTALIPIGVVAGLSAVVTVLLIIALAGNKIQGIAMVRALGMLIAGLPCLPWFIDSPWNLAFGVLPPYWAAKAFWVATAHGTWWPYLVGGVVYNLAIAGPLFRRFLAKNS